MIIPIGWKGSERMKKEEAIIRLSRINKISNKYDRTAFDMAIKALEQTELNSSYNSINSIKTELNELDCISRQSVLEKAYKIAGYDRNAYVVDVADIEALPSVKLCEDAINRKDAINAMSNALERVFPEHRDIAETVMNNLPSVSCSENPNRCEDAISRQTVRDMLKDINADTDGVGFYYEHYDEYIKNLPSVSTERTGRWIPVSERLPESDEYVLVTNGRGIYIGWIDLTDKRWRVDYVSEYFMEGIVAWMPLPASYQGE